MIVNTVGCSVNTVRDHLTRHDGNHRENCGEPNNETGVTAGTAVALNATIGPRTVGVRPNSAKTPDSYTRRHRGAAARAGHLVRENCNPGRLPKQGRFRGLR